MRAYDSEWRDGVSFSFLIFRRTDEGQLGGVTLSNVRRGVAETASLGYWIGAPAARQGYMTEAARTMLRFGFKQLSLHRIYATCDPDNIGSVRVLEKLGMRREGYLRQNLWLKDHWHDRTASVSCLLPIVPVGEGACTGSSPTVRAMRKD